MTEDEIKTLKKEVSSKKRIATEWASQIHDLVEDRLWTDYTSLPELARKTLEACEDWADANARYDREAKA
jgi:hypothetical protein